VRGLSLSITEHLFPICHEGSGTSLEGKWKRLQKATSLLAGLAGLAGPPPS